MVSKTLMKRSIFTTVLLSGILALTTHAELTVASVFSDHAVLQRDMEVAVWGTADAGTKVSVKIGTRSGVCKSSAAAVRS